MALYRFQSFPRIAVAKFDCPVCGKPKRSRTFRAECTVNPFNTRPDGLMRTPAEVAAQSAEEATKERDAFLREPMCKTCEDKLGWKERTALRERRFAALKAAQSVQETP